MEIVFIRHGQGEHTLNPPDSLQIKDPLVSPTRRTIQTTLFWSNNTKCEIIIYPAVGPRMFPMLPASKAFQCDTILSKVK